MGKKLDLLFDLYISQSKLRRFGLYNGSLDLNRMNYWMSEIADHRNHLIHGHLEVVAMLDDDIKFTFHRRVKESDAPGGLELCDFRTFRSHLRHQIQVAEMLALFFRDAACFIRDEIPSDFYADRAKKQARQKEWWEREGQFMGLVIPENLRGIEPSLKGEIAAV